MKKILYALIAILLLGQIGLSAITISNDEIASLAGLEAKYCVSFTIPNDNVICVPENLFNVLIKTAEDTNSNIFRTVLRDGDNGGYVVEKYVLLTADSRYCNEFDITNGRFLTPQESQSEDPIFVASYQSELLEQVGTIHSHMLGMDVVFYPLFQEFSTYQASGLYYAELPGNISEAAFLNALSKNIEAEFGYWIDAESLLGQTNIVGIPYVDTFFYQASILALLMLTIILMLYYLLRENKRISVMKLHGISAGKIVWNMQASFHVVFLTVFLSAGIVLFVAAKDIAYCVDILKECLLLYIVLFILLYAIGIVYVNRCMIQSMLKGNSHTSGILRTNYIVKLICLLLLLYVGQSIYTYSSDVIFNKSIYKAWEGTENYGVFYPLYIGNESSHAEQLATAATINSQLYSILNEDGALYISANEYTKEALEVDSEYDGYRSITINGNYLATYPIYDNDGLKIGISEEETDWILLVPESLSAQEEEILSQFYAERKSRKYYDEEYYGVETSDVVNNQQIKIIWLNDGQSVFCMNPNVGDMGNLTDVIIQVVTESNRYICDTDCILGKGSEDPLKVKLHGNGNQTYSDIEDALEELGLDDNLKYIVSVNETISERLSELTALLQTTFIVGIIVLAVLLFVSVQSCIIVFDKNKKDYIIKKMHGWSRWKTYISPIRTNIVLSIIACFLYLGVAILLSGGIVWKYSFVSAIIVIAIEIVVFTICTTILEQRKIADVLKGA